MKMRMKYPASCWRNRWREALACGNGTIGAAVFGGVQEETVIINHADLWHGGRQEPLPDVSHTLQETRRLMEAKQYREASWHLADALKERGYGVRMPSRLPLACLRLAMPCAHAFRQYERSIQLDTGEAVVSWRDGEKRMERRMFVSRADDVIVMDIRCDHAGSLSGEVSLEMLASERWMKEPAFQELQRSVAVRTEGSYFMYTGKNDDGSSFGAVLRLISDGGQTAAGEKSIRFEEADHVMLLVKVFAKSNDAEREWDRLKTELAVYGASVQYEELLERHAALHRPLMQSAWLQLNQGEIKRTNEELLLEAYEGDAPAELVQLMWAYGRYLFISGTGAQPFGLYGLWAGDYRLIWGHHMANENIQMMYWHAHVGGLGVLADSLYRYYSSMLDVFRNNARKLYGMKGIYIPAGTAPGQGQPNQIVPVILNWTGAAGWLARHYYEHFLFTGDVSFLKETAWPFMKEAVAFYEDFLVMGEDGFYRMYPSVSPENTPLHFMPEDGQALAHPMPTAINATMDFAIIKELLRNLLEAAPWVGESREVQAKWERMLERMPPYEINEDGAVREWMHSDFEDRYEHRHLSHLYPVFPGQEVDRSEHPEIFRAFETAVRLRKLGAQTGWSLAHMASIYARLGDGDRALDCLSMLARSCLLPNLWTVHNDWRQMGITMEMPAAPVQMDANMGWVNAVQEMLLYVSSSLVKLLPALPSAWRRGRVEKWRHCAGSVTMEWDLEAGRFFAKIDADRDADMHLELPACFSAYSISGQGAYRTEPEAGGLRVRVKLTKGAALFIRG